MLLQILIFLLDIVLLNAAFLLAFILRYGFDIPEANFAPYRQIFPALTFCYMLAFALCRVFRKRFKAYWQIFANVFMGMFFGTLIAFVFLYVFRIKWSTFPSSIFLISFLAGTVIITFFNAAIYRLFKRIVKIVVLVKDKDNDLSLVNLEDGSRIKHKKVNSIFQILKHKEIDEIMLCDHIHDDNQLNLLVYLLLKLKVRVYFEPGIYAELLSGNLQNGNSLRYLATFLGQKTEAEEFFIRLLDILCSLIIIPVSLPLIFLISILIKVTSKGPVLFTQKRVGKDGSVFTIYKFRTMINNADITPVVEDDHRVTKLGKILRQTRLDELPQLFNIIKGEMSFVGPRPENVYRVNLHKALQGLRLAVKPGLTGLAQIRNAYDLHPKHKIKYDYLYIQKRSLLLNIYILFKTIPVVLLKKGQ